MGSGRCFQLRPAPRPWESCFSGTRATCTSGHLWAVGLCPRCCPSPAFLPWAVAPDTGSAPPQDVLPQGDPGALFDSGSCVSQPGWAPGSGLLPVAGKPSACRPGPRQVADANPLSCLCRGGRGCGPLGTEVAFPPTGSLGKGPGWQSSGGAGPCLPGALHAPHPDLSREPALCLPPHITAWHIPLYLSGYQQQCPASRSLAFPPWSPWHPAGTRTRSWLEGAGRGDPSQAGPAETHGGGQHPCKSGRRPCRDHHGSAWCGRAGRGPPSPSDRRTPSLGAVGLLLSPFLLFQ